LDDTCIDGAHGPRAAQANDCPRLIHYVCVPSEVNSDRYNQDPPEVVQLLEHDCTPLASHRLDTTEHTSSKRKQAFQVAGLQNAGVLLFFKVLPVSL
jgi:hypothetical protein